AGRRLPLEADSRIVVVGGGKAGAAMAAGVEAALGVGESGIRVEGSVTVKDGHLAPTERIALQEAGHPIPDRRGAAGVAQIEAALEGLRPQDVVLALLSGGGSALLTAPVEGVSLDDKRRLTDLLLRAGATIGELNTVRRHLSRLKGGRLARPAR